MTQGTQKLCRMLRTKMGYFRTDSGERMIDPASSTACYECLRTQRPFGPDGAPAGAEHCAESRRCYEEDLG